VLLLVARSTLMDFNTDSNEMEVFESSAWCQTNVPVSSSHGAQLRESLQLSQLVLCCLLRSVSRETCGQWMNHWNGESMGWVNSKLVVPRQSRKIDGSAHPQTRPKGGAAQLPYPTHAPTRTNGTRWQWQMYLQRLDREPVAPSTRMWRIYLNVVERNRPLLVSLSNVMETKSLCHGSGKVDSKFTNLSLNVLEIGVTRPSTHLLDDVVVAPSEFESHGSPRA
jgi:hypothetical protein